MSQGVPHDHLERLRLAEMDIIRTWFHPGMRVLEIGGGSGLQARILTSWGCSVISLELPDHVPTEIEHFRVQPYDGLHIPFLDGSFDAVFSSNVLEHVTLLPELLAETRRVLTPNGVAVHVVPSSTWRFWTSISHYPYMVKRLLGRDRRGKSAAPISVVKRRGLAWSIWRALWAAPHGEYPTALSELYFFSKPRWRTVFERNGFRVTNATVNHLFYTGNIVFPTLRLTTRRTLSHALGSSCNVFLLSRRSV